jgi:hypothetical protein
MHSKKFMVMPQRSKPFMAIDLSYTPFFIGRNLSPMQLDQNFTEKFSHDFSYSTGINIGFFVKRNIQIQTGFWYSPRTYTSEIDGNFNGGSGRIVSRYMPNYLSVPLNFKIVLREKVSPFIKIGGLVDILSTYSLQSNFFGSATFDDMSAYTKTKEQFEKTRYSLVVSFGITAGGMRKKSTYFQLEPMFVYSLSPDSKTFSSKYCPFYYGLSLSFGFNFKRKENYSKYNMPDEEEYEEEIDAE